MSNPRYDIYTTFHKLLRARLFDVSTRLGRTDFSAEDRGRDTLVVLRDALIELEEHAGLEDSLVHPVLRSHSCAIVRELDAAHRSLDIATATLEDLADEIGAASPAASARIGARLYATWNTFVAEQVLHMGSEERESNAVLWAKLDDRAIAEIHRQIMGKIPAERCERHLAALLPIISHPERVAMFRRAASTAPPELVAPLRDIGARTLGATAWADVERATRA
jgi:hypothetical protein